MKKILLFLLVSLIFAMIFSSCTVIIPQVQEASKHKHQFDTAWAADANLHWHACECGERNELATHADENDDHICDTCGYQLPVVVAEYTVTVIADEGINLDSVTYKVAEGTDLTFRVKLSNEYVIVLEGAVIEKNVVGETSTSYTIKIASVSSDITVTIRKQLACTHSWNVENPTCTEDKICQLCGELDAEKLGHNWLDATCTDANKCSRCDAEFGEALGHIGGNATCTEQAVCNRCSKPYGDTLGHDLTDATCLADSECRRCDYVEEGSALGHDMTEASCTEDSKCTRCDYVEEGSSVGHTWNIEEATCTEYKYCTACNYISEYARGHDYSVPATCTTANKCSRCDSTKGQPLGHMLTELTCTENSVCTRADCDYIAAEATGHRYNVEAATCKVAKYCLECGEEAEAALGHDWDEGAVTAPTCTATGYTTFTCRREGCGATEKRNVTEMIDHSWKNATCTEPKTCSSCGKTEGLSNGHVWNTSHATCIEDKHCLVCGVVAEELKDHDLLDATCTLDQRCSTPGCSYIVTESKLGHDWQKGTPVAATCETDGYTPCVCAREGCGATENQDVVGKLGHTGGSATCSVLAVCTREGCGKSYGDYNSDLHTGLRDEWIADPNNSAKHIKVCSDCEATVESADHIGGNAYCNTLAVCTICNTEYGSFNPDRHSATADEYSSDEDYHWLECPACHANTGKVAHTMIADPNKDGTHTMKCDCGRVGETVNCTGGTATCTDQPICDICKVAYGNNLGGHRRSETITEATCEHDGTIVYGACVREGCTYAGETIKTADKLDHNYQPTEEVVYPTCVDSGYTVYKCVNGCNATDNRDETPATGEHVWETVKVDPTYTTPGTEYKHCTVCGEKGEETELPVKTPETFKEGENSIAVTGKVITVIKLVAKEAGTYTFNKPNSETNCALYDSDFTTAIELPYKVTLAAGEEILFGLTSRNGLNDNIEISVSFKAASDGSNKIVGKLELEASGTGYEEIYGFTVPTTGIYTFTIKNANGVGEVTPYALIFVSDEGEDLYELDYSSIPLKAGLEYMLILDAEETDTQIVIEYQLTL